MHFGSLLLLKLKSDGSNVVQFGELFLNPDISTSRWLLTTPADGGIRVLPRELLI